MCKDFLSWIFFLFKTRRKKDHPVQNLPYESKSSSFFLNMVLFLIKSDLMLTFFFFLPAHKMGNLNIIAQ